MAKIDWDEYKQYKQFSVKKDNFEILLEFIKSYYNLVHAQGIYDMLREDEIAQLMLNKRSIKDAEGLEAYLF